MLKEIQIVNDQQFLKYSRTKPGKYNSASVSAQIALIDVLNIKIFWGRSPPLMHFSRSHLLLFMSFEDEMATSTYKWIFFTLFTLFNHALIIQLSF